MICVRNLNCQVGDKKLLENISLNLEEKQALAIIGKSGSGKSLLARSLLALLDRDFYLRADEFFVDEIKPLKANSKTLQILRTRAALVFQDVMASFYPFLDVGALFHLILKTHTRLNAKMRKEKAFFYLHRFGLENLELIWHSYVHQLSVGMARRVSLALALVCEPRYLICDEITCSLDHENELRIYEFLKELKKDLGIILITHDLNGARELADEILVLEEGKCIEKALKDEFFQAPKSEYAKNLLAEFKKEKYCF